MSDNPITLGVQVETLQQAHDALHAAREVDPLSVAIGLALVHTGRALRAAEEALAHASVGFCDLDPPGSGRLDEE